MIRWTPIVLPCFGALLAGFLVYSTLTQGFSLRMPPGLAFSLFFLFIPLLSKRTQKDLYAKSITSAQVAWTYFGKFFEDERAFVLYQKNQTIFHPIPKRALSADQVVRFRQYLEPNVKS